MNNRVRYKHHVVFCVYFLSDKNDSPLQYEKPFAGIICHLDGI
ncbi:hypothetical protein [Pollutibacter soli]